MQCASAADPPRGIVQLDRNTFTDADGPLLGLGVTYMQAFRHCKYDRPRLEANLAFLSQRGFKFVRVLTMLAWPGLEIAPADFKNFDGDEVDAWLDYWDQFDALIDIVHAHGMRTEITIFADAQLVMPERDARVRHLVRILTHLAGREEKVMFLEIANEAWQNGFPGTEGIADLRAGGQYLADRTELLVTLSSPSDLQDRGAELKALYEGSAADLAMIHFSRDIRTPLGGWLPVIDPWNYLGQIAMPILSNEPIGPGASVNTETDPAKLVAAAAYSFLAGLPGYVFHTGAGVRAEQSFESMAGVDNFKNLLSLLPADLPNWTRNDGEGDSAPFQVVQGVVVRNCGAINGNRFVAMPVGVGPEGVTLAARKPCKVKVYDPRTAELFLEKELGQGDRIALPPGDGTWWIAGTLEP